MLNNITTLRIQVMAHQSNVTVYNITDEDLQKIMEMHQHTAVSNLSAEFDEGVALNCGGAFEVMATIYANDYHFFCSMFVCLVGTVTNILNIIVLTRKDMIVAPINRILTALAVADMILMVEYIPFAYYYHLDLLGKRDFPYIGAVFMLMHVHFSQILHTTSICLTLTLAIWRYLAIGYMEKNHILCSQRRCTYAIATCYILPLLLCSPSYFTLKISYTTIVEDKEYILYHLTLTDFLQKDKMLLKVNFWLFAVIIKLWPCIVLTVITCWLIRTLFRAKRRKQVLKGQNTFLLENSRKACNRKIKKSERRADRTTKMLIAILILFLLTEFPQGLFAFFIGLNGKDLFLECYQKYGEVMDILALTNGSINFVLYCCMNRMFRITFGQLFGNKILRNFVVSSATSDVHTTCAIKTTSGQEIITGKS